MRVLSLLALLALLVAAPPALRAQQPSSDDKIHDDVMRRLAADSEVKGGGIEVDVAAGVVTLRGKVREAKQADRAERITRKVKGVKQVINQLKADAGVGSSAGPATP